MVLIFSENAELHFNYKIVCNSKNYTGDLIDYFHKKAKSISNSGESDPKNNLVYTSAVNVLNTTTNLTKNIGSNIKNFLWKN